MIKICIEIAKGRKEIYLGEEMTHSDFDFFGDVAAPLTKWLKSLNMMNFKVTEQEPKESESHLINNNHHKTQIAS